MTARPGERCERSDLLVTECAHCKGVDIDFKGEVDW